MQFFGADERTVTGNSPSLLYPGTFTWEKPDGTTEEITVPGSYDVPAGEIMVITSTLPADFDASSIAIRSSLQDVNIYINGTLREQYSTSKTRLIGKNSASRFIFISIPFALLKAQNVMKKTLAYCSYLFIIVP